MRRKIGIIMFVLVLGVMFAGELMVLSAQKTEQTSDHSNRIRPRCIACTRD